MKTPVLPFLVASLALWGWSQRFNDAEAAEPAAQIPPIVGTSDRELQRLKVDALGDLSHLEIVGLLGPQRAVIVEGRDALIGRYEIGSTILCDPFDEIDDRCFRRTLLPRWQRTGLRLGHGRRGTQSGR